jgi:hypothetical protein
VNVAVIWRFFLGSCEMAHIFVQMYSDNLIPQLLNTAQSCSRHSPAAAWLTLAWPGNVLPVPETSALLGVGVHCLSSSQHSTVLLIMSHSVL